MTSPTITTRPCTSCDRPATRRGLCHRHYEFQRRRLHAYGRWESRYVDAAPVRAHILTLKAAGLGSRRIADLAAVNRKTIQWITTGRSERGAPPASRVAADNAAAILAVPVPDSALDKAVGNSVPIPAVGTTRRLQALVAYGYSQSDVIALLGYNRSDSNWSPLFRGTVDAVTAGKARAVAALFNDLQMTPGDNDRARIRGAAKGWALPFDWDEDSIDDPDQAPIKFSAAEVAAARKREHEAEIDRLSALGMQVRDIAARVGVTTRTVHRRRAETHGDIEASA